MSNSAATQQSIETQGDDAAGSTGLVLQDTYVLGECIGKGGMGEVYEATHVRLPGHVAVKILRPHLLTNDDAFARFCREAEIMSALQHPHIVQIFDFNTALDGRPYFVMEYLDGVDLEARLADAGALPLPALVRIVDAVASALGAAHAAGIVHRDLKPANIFLMRGEGQDRDFVKVIDFGISKAPGPGRRLSRASEVMGTPEFMAPEQALGLVGEIDARTDQFALAAITFAMLTGREPFVGGDPASLLYQVVHEEPPRLSGFLAWDTTEIQSVLDRALAKRPEDRFDSIVEFAWALRVAAHSVIRGHAPPRAIPRRSPAAAPTTTRVRTSRPVPRAVAALERPELPRRLDRVPHGPQRTVALGLAVLGLAAVIVHKGWYRGFAGRATNVEQKLVRLVRGEPRTPPSGVPASAPEPAQIATAPREVPPPSREPLANIIAVDDETPPLAQQAPPRIARARATAQPARHQHHRALSRSGWQTIELPYHAPAPPSETSSADGTMPPTPARSSTPPPLLVPDGFSIPEPAPMPPARDLAPAPAPSD